MGNMLLTAIVPHPPIIIPEVGQGEEQKAQKTINGLKKLSQEIAALNPETVVIITPHSEFNPYFFSVYTDEKLYGDFSGFRAMNVKLSFENDIGFIKTLSSLISDDFIKLNSIKNKPLDHGSLVPLYYFHQAGFCGKIVVINYTMLDKPKHKLFGEKISEAAKILGRNSVFAASGDLSHKLSKTAPAGYNPDAKDFDELVVQAVSSGCYELIEDINPELRHIAGECGYNSMITAIGAVGGKKCNNKVISYESPFGVGYLVATL